ncbi:SDR family oxidoreductase, partial [Candidatus Thorarchaeota archaeon]
MLFDKSLEREEGPSGCIKEIGANRMDLGLKNYHVLITGASGGIGFESTRAFLEEGARVSATYYTSEKKLSELENSWSEQLALFRVDIRDESQVRTLFENAVKRFGRVDVLVANAGIAHHEGKAIQELELAQWNETILVNLTGAFLVAKYFFLNLEKNVGDNASLILIGSTAGYFGEAWYSDYSASKAGMHGLLMSLKNEIGHVARNGRVNLINPGWTHTPMAEGALNDSDMMKRILQTIPLRKVAQPSDIANTILYLASDCLSGHVSGATINVAGGMEGRVLFQPDEL